MVSDFMRVMSRANWVIAYPKRFNNLVRIRTARMRELSLTEVVLYEVGNVHIHCFKEFTSCNMCHHRSRHLVALDHIRKRLHAGEVQPGHSEDSSLVKNSS